MNPDSFENWWKKETELDNEREKRRKEEENLQKNIELYRNTKKK